MGLGGRGEAYGGVLQSDDLWLADELLQVRPVLEAALTVQGEHLEDGDDVTGQIVLRGHPDPPLSSPETGLQGVRVNKVHGTDFLAAAVQDGLPANIKIIMCLL